MGHLLHVIPLPNISHLCYASVKLSSKNILLKLSIRSRVSGTFKPSTSHHHLLHDSCMCALHAKDLGMLDNAFHK